MTVDVPALIGGLIAMTPLIIGLIYQKADSLEKVVNNRF